MARFFVASVTCALCLAGHIHAAPVVVRVPSLTCPETELGDEALQDRYKAMWDKYSADVDATTKKLQAELEKQEADATASGNLKLVLFWQSRAKEFGQNGELKWDDAALKKTWKQQYGVAFPASFTVAAKKASDGFQSAQQGLKTGYDDLISELTKAGNLPKALKLQAESDELLAVKATAEKPAQPEPVATAPKNGKYRFVFDDNGWGFLLELQDDTLWIHGDVNPDKPGGIAVWPKGPRAMPCRVVGGKVLVDDGDPKANKWRCVIKWDVKTGVATHEFDDYKGKSFQKQGRITASSW